MFIIRKKLEQGDVIPKGKRFNTTTDTVQFSPDGGVTWNDDPASDPRHNPAGLLPPRSGGTAKCDAAESMMQHFRAQVDAFITGGTIVGVVNLWLGLLLFLPGVGILIALLFTIADVLFSTGVVVVDAAMTEPVYDQIKCILLCHMGEDGQMTAEQVEAVYADVDDQIGGVAGEVFKAVTGAWGEVGFSNAGASGEYTGDCDECPDCLTCIYALDGEGLNGWVVNEYGCGAPDCCDVASYDAINDRVDGGLCATIYLVAGLGYTLPAKPVTLAVRTRLSSGSGGATIRLQKNGTQFTETTSGVGGLTVWNDTSEWDIGEGDVLSVTFEASSGVYLSIDAITLCYEAP